MFTPGGPAPVVYRHNTNVNVQGIPMPPQIQTVPTYVDRAKPPLLGAGIPLNTSYSRLPHGTPVTGPVAYAPNVDPARSLEAGIPLGNYKTTVYDPSAQQVHRNMGYARVAQTEAQRARIHANTSAEQAINEAYAACKAVDTNGGYRLPPGAYPPVGTHPTSPTPGMIFPSPRSLPSTLTAPTSFVGMPVTPPCVPSTGQSIQYVPSASSIPAVPAVLPTLPPTVQMPVLPPQAVNPVLMYPSTPIMASRNFTPHVCPALGASAIPMLPPPFPPGWPPPAIPVPAPNFVAPPLPPQFPQQGFGIPLPPSVSPYGTPRQLSPVLQAPLGQSPMGHIPLQQSPFMQPTLGQPPMAPPFMQPTLGQPPMAPTPFMQPTLGQPPMAPPFLQPTLGQPPMAPTPFMQPTLGQPPMAPTPFMPSPIDQSPMAPPFMPPPIDQSPMAPPFMPPPIGQSPMAPTPFMPSPYDNYSFSPYDNYSFSPSPYDNYSFSPIMIQSPPIEAVPQTSCCNVIPPPLDPEMLPVPEGEAWGSPRTSLPILPRNIRDLDVPVSPGLVITYPPININARSGPESDAVHFTIQQAGRPNENFVYWINKN